MMLAETILLSILVSLADCQCSGDRTSGDYTASWNVRTGGTSVQFNVSVPALLNTWVAIGFSSSGNMINSDIVMASSDGGGKSFVEDRWAVSQKMPTYDTDQDIWDTSVTFVNGSLSMSFIRNIYTLKENDYRLDRCVYVLGAWGGQVTNYSSPSQFSKHSSMTVFDQLMCLQSCSDYVPPSISSTTSAVGAATSMLTSIPSSTKSETSSDGLSTTYIIVIAVIGFLVLVAVSLFVTLCCIWLVGSKTRRVMTVYELKNANPSKYPANDDNNGYSFNRSTFLSDGLMMGTGQYNNPLPNMVKQPLLDPLTTQQNDTFPIPSRQNISVQDYEIPVSQTTPLSGDKQSELHVYSTLDDVANEKHHYEGNVDFGDTGSNNYTSLYPPNMADVQPYVSCTPSPNEVPPPQINEPLISFAKIADNN